MKKKAFLTQKSQSDSFYHSYTICPIHEEKVDATATDLYQMVKINEFPLDKTLPDLDCQCFPDIHPYGTNGQNPKRYVRLTHFEYWKSRFMSKHRQYRSEVQYLFYALNDNYKRQLNAGIFHKLNITNPKVKYTAASYLDQL